MSEFQYGKNITSPASLAIFLVTPNALAGIDREGKRLESGQTISYLAGIALGERGSTPS